MKMFLATLAGLMAALSFPRAAASDPDFSPMSGLIQKTKDATALPSGTAVAVVKDGKIIHEGYFGYSDIGAQAPVTRDTGFYIASATKPFFALNVLLKEGAGQLDTHMSLQQMFPGIRFKDGIDATSVTARDLLVHTSGVDNQPLVWATAFTGIHDARSLRALVAASYPDAEAAHGTFEYTNVGYNILSVWLDRKLATPWQDQLANAIFKPLHMVRTSAYISEAEAKGWQLAKPYSFASTRPSASLYLRKSDDTMQAAGGMVSTAPDLAAFLIAELADGKSGNQQALPGPLIEQSRMPQVELDARYLDFKRTGYAWGWYSGVYKGKSMRHAFGAYPGFHAHLSFIPEADIGLVVVNNEDVLSARLTSLIADYVYGLLLDEPGIDSRMSHRFEALITQSAEMKSAIAVQRTEIQGRAWHLSQPVEAYVGTYSNALLGDMTVALDDKRKLLIHWGRLTAAATGYEDTDRVRVEFAPNSGKVLDFIARGGRIESISFDDVTFDRHSVAAARALSRR